MTKHRDVIRVVDKLNQKSVFERLSSIDWSSGSSSPYIVEFDITTRCNLACPDCISGSLLNKEEFSQERVLSLAREMVDAGVRGVILIGGGEPMLHSRLAEIIEIFGSNGVAIGITTNGLFLKKHLETLMKYVDWVRVSVDAASSEVFKALRPSRAGESMFAHVLDNMAAWASVKRPGQILGYSFMVFSSGDHGLVGTELRDDAASERVEHARRSTATNAHEIYAAASLAKKIGCDYIEIKPMYDVNHFLVRQTPAIARLIDEQLRMARELEDDNFRVIEATKLRASLGSDSDEEPKSYRRCAVSQMRTLVTPSGAYVCPYFRGVPDKKLGDLTFMSFGEMWRGRKRKEVMDELDPSRDCRMHCIRHDSNLHIENLIARNFEVASRSLVADYDPFI